MSAVSGSRNQPGGSGRNAEYTDCGGDVAEGDVVVAGDGFEPRVDRFPWCRPTRRDSVRDAPNTAISTSGFLCIWLGLEPTVEGVRAGILLRLFTELEDLHSCRRWPSPPSDTILLAVHCRNPI